VDVEHSYDHLLVAAMPDPFGLLADARTRCPVAHSDQYEGFWALFRHADIGAVARDPARFSSASGVTIPSHGFPMALPPIETDPPLHLQFRGPLLDRFSPGAVAALEPELRAAVRQLIAAFIEDGRADLASGLTFPLPAVGVGLLLDIPAADRAAVQSWTVRLIQDVTDMDAVGDAMEFFGQLYDQRSAHPTDDLASLVLALQIDGEPIREEDFLLTMTTLVNAGLDTTANAAANTLELLARRTEQRDELAARPELMSSAIEELLRFVTPLPSLCRTATTDVDLDGHHITAGERIQLNWIAANHDPTVFEDPETLRLDRAHNRHFAFGAGPHRCLGAHLARLELRIMVEEVLRYLPDYRIDTESIVRYAGVTRGISSLPCRFTPRPASVLAGAAV
jgi:cytochrome P450